MSAQRFVVRRHQGHAHGPDGPGGGHGVLLPRVRSGPTAVVTGGVLGVPPSGVEAHLVAPPLAVSEQRAQAGSLPVLAPGSAEGGLVYFDAPSGAGGDMLVASLVDMGVPWSVVSGAVEGLGLAGVELDLRRGNSGALSGLRFVVDVDTSVTEKGERSYARIRQLVEASRLSCGVVEKVLRVFERLARAESRAHHVPVADVHFHEVGALDSIADIVGACAALHYLGGTVACSPLPLGRGFVSCRHGVIPLPAPATVECLMGLQTYDAGIELELVTPTAAAVLGALATGSSGWPSGVLTAVGWGRGSMTLPDRPNLVRAVLVRPPHPER